MRFHVLASDYDGTLAHNERVSPETIEKLKHLKLSNRKIILVTGREMRDLERVFPEHGVFNYIVAENGALIYTPETGKEELLGDAPDDAFIKALEEKGVAPISVGKVIVATWELHENTVLDVIKKFGIERQVIFNKGAVMILPPGINKATGLQKLLDQLHLSLHNTVAVGDAENDSAMLMVAACSVAVSNALPTLKETVDFVTKGDHGKGVEELIDDIIDNDLENVLKKQTRYDIPLGTDDNEKVFTIKPYRPGILLSGASGGGKSTLTISISESLAQLQYQFCLIDPEGDYLELPGAVIVGNESTLPAIEEIIELLKNPKQSLVVCVMSIAVHDRPVFFTKFLTAFMQLRKDYGHPHWLLLDEAHHLAPGGVNTFSFEELNNFILISQAVESISPALLKKVGTLMIVGDNSAYAVEHFFKMCDLKKPAKIPAIEKGEACVFDVKSSKAPYVIKYNPPKQLQQRHKRKYALGEMGDNSFIFTGSKNKLNLKANNLSMFVHLAQGIDDDTWNYHLKQKDYTKWFKKFLHDDELTSVSEEAEKEKNAEASKKLIIDFITQKYMA